MCSRLLLDISFSLAYRSSLVATLEDSKVSSWLLSALSVSLRINTPLFLCSDLGTPHRLQHVMEWFFQFCAMHISDEKRPWYHCSMKNDLGLSFAKYILDRKRLETVQRRFFSRQVCCVIRYNFNEYCLTVGTLRARYVGCDGLSSRGGSTPNAAAFHGDCSTLKSDPTCR